MSLQSGMVNERMLDPAASPPASATPVALTRLASLPAVIAWTVWVLMLANSVRFVGAYASDLMLADDLSLAWIELDPRGLTWEYLWSAHGEHRIPLAQLIQYGLYAATGDVRSGCFFQVALLAATAAACMAVARRIRGRAAVSDAFFPLLWMHTGNYENLLMGFQVSLMLCSAIVAALILIAATRARGFGPVSALAASVALIALPLSGGAGMMQAPLITAWLAFAAWKSARGPHSGSRWASAILWCGVVATITLAVLYVRDYDALGVTQRHNSVGRTLEHAVFVFTHALGPIGGEWWPWTGWLSFALAASASVIAIRAMRVASERVRAAGLLLGLWANLCVGLGIAYGRPAEPSGEIGFAVRYIGLTAPAFAAAHLCWLAYGRPAGRALVHGGACIAFATAFFASSYPQGEIYGRLRRDTAAALVRDLAAGMTPMRFFHAYRGWVDDNMVRFAELYMLLAKARVAPFDEMPDSVCDAFAYPMFVATPSAVRGHATLDPETVAPGKLGLLAIQGTAIDFLVPESAKKLRGEYAVPLAPPGPHDLGPLHFRIAWRMKDQVVPLFDRALDPQHVEADRGVHTFDVDLPAARGGTVTLRIVRDAERPAARIFGWWNAVEFR